MLQVARQPHPSPQAGNASQEKSMQKPPLKFINEDRFSINMGLSDSESDASSLLDLLNINVNRGGGVVPTGLPQLIGHFDQLCINLPPGECTLPPPPPPKKCFGFIGCRKPEGNGKAPPSNPRVEPVGSPSAAPQGGFQRPPNRNAYDARFQKPSPQQGTWGAPPVAGPRPRVGAGPQHVWPPAANPAA